ncbi:DNA repair and recombination protein RAD54 [Cyclospora cayetanensis]|uniref:DNA repair and recombination protein RAD54 n=1 Tax=Cyclospora cayetanensis TaxID=88456 RepID=A0A6P6RYW3_9EIME|nr:DNA repair and recombination protein RAD54 [Cyclospora cayetanensis]
MEGHFHFRANFQPPWQKRIDSYKTGKLTLESRSPVGMKRAFTTTATDQGNNPRTDAPKLREDMCESKETSANTAQIVTSSCYKEESMQHYSAPKLPACYAISFANKNQPQVTPYKGAPVTKSQLRISAAPPYKDSDTFSESHCVCWWRQIPQHLFLNVLAAIGGFQGEICSSPLAPEDFVSGRCFLQPSARTMNAEALALSTPRRTSGTQVPGFCQQGQTPSCENEPVDARVGEGGASVLFYEHYDSGPNDWQCEAPRKASEGSNAVASSGLVPLGEDFIDKKLRPHQKMGLHWMHSRIAAGGGCILADTMGLGKTLQALALLWSLLREHVVQHNAAPFKTLIVCPTSLKTNWRTEFKKWLGNRIDPLVACGDIRQVSEVIQTFTCSKRDQTLIASYDDIRRVDVPCSIEFLVCDEGHRLRSLRSQTYMQLQKIRSRRRLLLSGTPLQNNLEELYSCCHFVCPGTLPNEKTFKKVFLEPIIRGCRPEATETEVIIGLHRTNWGNGESSSHFMLRRTSEVLEQLREFAIQRVNLAAFSSRLVNVPEMFVTDQFASRELLKNGIQDEEDAELSEQNIALRGILQPSTHPGYAVIVSNSTAVLDKVESLIKKETWSFLRLDGSTPQPLRGSIVDKFNTDLVTRVFLLSSKAGGTGLNLTGANRLIHMDPDWNPANDQQALARIWRDGQVMPVYIYRFVGAETVEVQIMKRQLFKSSLAKLAGQGAAQTFVDGKGGTKGQWLAGHLADLLRPIGGTLATHACSVPTYYIAPQNLSAMRMITASL